MDVQSTTAPRRRTRSIGRRRWRRTALGTVKQIKCCVRRVGPCCASGSTTPPTSSRSKSQGPCDGFGPASDVGGRRTETILGLLGEQNLNDDRSRSIHSLRSAVTGNARLLMPRFSTHHSPANGPFGRIGCKMYAPGGGLIRHRRGRVPHVVVATAEPTVGRIASIAQGTGDLDAVFHVAPVPT